MWCLLQNCKLLLHIIKGSAPRHLGNKHEIKGIASASRTLDLLCKAVAL